MDNLVLEGIVSELRSRLIGWPVFRVAAAATDEVLVLFDDPDRSRLRVSACPDLPRLHLVSRREARHHERPDDLFAAAASHHLGGAVLASIEKAPADRIVRLRFAGPGGGSGKSLIAELFGRSSNLLVTDPTDLVLGAARRLKSAFRAPVAGEPYEPPRGAGARRDPRSLSRDEIEALGARSRREEHPLADLLLEAAPAIGPLAAKEIETRFERGDDPFTVLEEWIARVHEEGEGRVDVRPGFPDRRGPDEPSRKVEDGGIAPADRREAGGEDFREGRAARPPRGFVYAEGPLDALDPRRAPAGERLLVSPLPLASAEAGLLAIPFPSLNEAAEAAFDTLAAGRAFRARAAALSTIASKEARRSSGIVQRVARDLETMEQAGSLRLYGEALLAGLTRAEKRGSEALVPDPYDAEGRTLAVPIDPAIGLAANAERYFVRHRKAERGRAVAKERLASQTMRRDALADVAARAAEAGTEEALGQIEHALRALGIAVGIEHRAQGRRGARGGRRARAGMGGMSGQGVRSGPGGVAAQGASPDGSVPRVEGVRLYQSTDGYEILVGKGAEENDRLTFKIAAPEDFWLHALGASGAHVIVRNPRAEKKLPPATLREAAELAAFFSKAKDAGRAEVHVTRRKYVRRVRGGPRGTVIVKKGESVSVPPRNPFDQGAGKQSGRHQSD